MTITPPPPGARGFNPFPNLKPREDGYPPEPAVGSVLAWQITDGDPLVAVRTGDRWARTGDEESITWHHLCDIIGRDGWIHAGVAQTWAALIPVRPRTRNGADT